MEVSTLQEYLSASLIWTSIRNQLSDWWPWVIPEIQGIPWVLLVVQRNSERNGLFNHIWERRLTNHVVWVNEGSDYWFRTKSASCVLVKVKEVFSPYLYYSISILRSVSWVNREYSAGRIVSVRDGISNIREVSSQTNCERYNLSFTWGRTVFALKTCIVLNFKLTTTNMN